MLLFPRLRNTTPRNCSSGRSDFTRSEDTADGSFFVLARADAGKLADWRQQVSNFSWHVLTYLHWWTRALMTDKTGKREPQKKKAATQPAHRI
ncbi:uncharacterized protein PgNI_00380 [Pyricularia grisea]|uniref:Uncharacterized protein n=1 Tax=Pyricularia grisea TaxID=148305 RepID=A0A6P8BLI9_PYRGI|nr:uncharacterized protein PgNI_00380 [Pyricularia grisea]TLD17736.1 hypothetical protein PgNI_00380 [Pyricularia grisea]